jgi:hypothetical protein
MWRFGSAKANGEHSSVMRRVQRPALIVAGGACMPWLCLCQHRIPFNSALHSIRCPACLYMTAHWSSLVPAAAAMCLLVGSFVLQKPASMQQAVAGKPVSMQQAAAAKFGSMQQAVAAAVQPATSCQEEEEAASTQQMDTNDPHLQQRMAECLESSDPNEEVAPYRAEDFRAGRKPRCAYQACGSHSAINLYGMAELGSHCCRLKLEAVFSSQLRRQNTAVTFMATLSVDQRVRLLVVELD